MILNWSLVGWHTAFEAIHSRIKSMPPQMMILRGFMSLTPGFMMCVGRELRCWLTWGQSRRSV